MNLSYLVACGLMVTLLSVRIGAKPLSQAQQKVRGMHLHVTYPLIINALILLLYAVINVEMCRFRAEQLMCTPKCFHLISPYIFFCLNCANSARNPHHRSSPPALVSWS